MKKFDTKLLVTIGMLTAVHIVLSRFLSINAWNLKIGFAFVPVFIAAYCYGPTAAAIVGGLGDFLGAILFPIGPYFPGFTVSCALTGVVFGLLLHRRQSVPRIAAAVCLNQLGISLCVTTLWISILYGSPYLPLLATRVLQCAVLIPVEFLVIGAFAQTLMRFGRRGLA